MADLVKLSLQPNLKITRLFIPAYTFLWVEVWFVFSYLLLAHYSSRSSSWAFPTDFNKRIILIPKYSYYLKKPSHKGKTSIIKLEMALSKHRNLILTEQFENSPTLKATIYNEKANMHCKPEWVLLYTLYPRCSWHILAQPNQPWKHLCFAVLTVTLCLEQVFKLLPMSLSANLAEKSSRPNSSLSEMVFTHPTPPRHMDTRTHPFPFPSDGRLPVQILPGCNPNVEEANRIPLPGLLLGQGTGNS